MKRGWHRWSTIVGEALIRQGSESVKGLRAQIAQIKRGWHRWRLIDGETIIVRIQYEIMIIKAEA